MAEIRTKPLILIIEDEGLLSRMYSKKLISDGYDCEIADNGADGLKMAIEKKPDVIICDIMMPKMDGITVLSRLKESDETKEIPVLMLTNLSDEEYIEKALELGAVSYLVKNKLVPADVVNKIKEILEAQNKRPLVS
ncbi:response regulator [Candidatus Dojkabacteria bacterium]|nr:response regulator [Candidatus Dojkabacteria bacterium]